MIKMGLISVSGVSRIENKDAVYFNASFSEDNNTNYSITKSVPDIPFYIENRIQCDLDYTEFEKKVNDLGSHAGEYENNFEENL